MCKRFVIVLTIGVAMVFLAAGMAQAADTTGRGATSADESGPLYWQNDLALWTGVVFVVLLLLLWKLAWGPIADGLAKREKGVAGQIADAHRANQDAQERLAEYERKLDAAADEVRRLLADACRDADQSGRQIVEAARGEAKAEHQKALAEIDQAAADAVAELAARSTRLAVELAGKIVKAELRPADHAALVQQAVQDFTKPSEN